MTNNYEWDNTITPQDRPYTTMEWAQDRCYTDYSGAITFEQDITELTPWLHELMGLDRDRWSIIGFNASPASGRFLAEHGTRNNHRGDLIRVYAVDRTRASETHKEPGGLHKDQENIEVVEFLLHDLTLGDIFKCFKSVNFSLTGHGIDHSRIKVAGVADIPVQPE